MAGKQPQTQLLTSWQAADVFGVHESTIRRWQRLGWIRKHVGKNCRDVKYDPKEIKKRLRAHVCPCCGKPRG